MSEHNKDEGNLDDTYKNMVERQESGGTGPVNLGTVDMDKFKPNEAQDADMVLGYHSIPTNTLPSAGMFYAEGTTLHIRSAKVAEIRHFSTMDENNILDVDEKLNSILESCTRVTSNKKRMSYKDLLEEDRFFLILSIRDLTFPEPESQLSVDHVDKKGETHKIEVSKDNFTYFKVPETLDKYYDNDAKSFLIETKSFGIIKLAPPSVGIMQKMTQYIKDRQEKNLKVDQSVLQIMPYMISEWRGFTDKDIFKFEMEMNSWSNKKYSLIYKLAEQMKVGIKPDMNVQIGDDWEDVPIGFRDGIKSIFIVQDISGELL
jgi:hypothetical protein